MSKKLVFLAAFLLVACSRQGMTELEVGNIPSPLHGILYAAEENQSLGYLPRALAFDGNGDLSVALLSGKIGAAFLEPDFGVKFLKDNAGTHEAVGVVEFPYGATLVVRKGLDLKIRDLAGRTVASSTIRCKLARQFSVDAERFGLPVRSVNWVYLPFKEMVPALEATKIDAAVLKGSHALLAKNLGHSILYQNWNMAPGDECCPAIVAQTEFILVVRKGWKGIRPLQQALVEAGKKRPAEIRDAIIRRTGYDGSVLSDLPITSYRVLDAKQASELLAHFAHGNMQDGHHEYDDH